MANRNIIRTVTETKEEVDVYTSSKAVLCGTDDKSLEACLSELETNLTNMNDELQLKASSQSLIDSVSDINESISTTNIEVTKVKQNLVTIDQSITGINNNIATIEETIGSEDMGTGIASVKGSIANINNQLTGKANSKDVKIFSSLGDIGLTLNDMTTDFGANVLKILQAMGRNRRIVLYPYEAESNTNLYNSVKSWCGHNTDAYTIIIESSFNGAVNLPNKIEVYPNTNTGNNKYFIAFYDNIMGVCREIGGMDSTVDLPLRSTVLEYAGVSNGYRNKIVRKADGTLFINFCVRKADGTNIAANELLFIADIPAGYRMKAQFGSASIWAGFVPSLTYVDASNILMCRAAESGVAVVGNIVGELI